MRDKLRKDKTVRENEDKENTREYLKRKELWMRMSEKIMKESEERENDDNKSDEW